MLLILKALMLTALTVAAWVFLARQGGREAIAMPDCAVAYVHDGDTIAMACEGRPEVTARLHGFDTAETKEPRCDEERAHGSLAADRLRQLLARGSVEIARVGRDRYHRPLIRLSVQGEDVGETLIRERPAVPYWGGTRIDWCQRLGARVE